ncbi:MAG: hypothetical protein ACLUBI_12535 [Clostridium sp.]|uniref:hypothetical protein n=1 Tax=Clostridium sp. TaxID=1506 RepID=UPI0039937AD0
MIRMRLVKNLSGKPVIVKKELEEYLGTSVSKYIKNLIPCVEFNGLGQGALRVQFEEYNNVFYEDETIIYLTLAGALKITRILMDKNIISLDINMLRNRLEQGLILRLEGMVG